MCLSVSVVIPTYHDWNRLNKCLDALQKQTYPINQIQIIVVNNDPKDSSILRDKISNLIITNEEIKSSYAARNKGLQFATGEVIAFTDSDCIPDPNWISNGINCMRNNDADLISGKVSFILTKKFNLFQLYDSVINIDNEYSVRNGIGKTANLFVKSSLFFEIGNFLSDVQSGGDVEWTLRAKNAGKCLRFCNSSVVYHPTRGMRESLKKTWRVSQGVRRTRKYVPGLVNESKRLLRILGGVLIIRIYKVRSQLISRKLYSHFNFFLILIAIIMLKGLKAIGYLYEAFFVTFCINHGK